MSSTKQLFFWLLYLFNIVKKAKLAILQLGVNDVGSNVYDAEFSNLRKVFILPGEVVESRVYHYNEKGEVLNYVPIESRFSKVFSLASIKDSNLYLAGTGSGNLLVLDVTKTTVSREFIRGSLKQQSLIIWQGNIALSGTSQGVIYKLDYIDDSDLGNIDMTAGTERIEYLEVINKGNTIIVGHESDLNYYQILDASTLTVLKNNVPHGALFSALSPEFSNIYYYVVITIPGWRLLKIRVSDDGNQNQLMTSSKSYKIKEVKGMDWIVGFFTETGVKKIGIYTGELAVVVEHTIAEITHDITFLAIHDEKPIVVLGSNTPSFPHIFFKITDMCDPGCQETCIYRRTLTTANCGTCLENFEEVSPGVCGQICLANQYRDLVDFQCKACPNCCTSGCYVDTGENELKCNNGPSAGFYVKDHQCQDCPNCCLNGCAYSNEQLSCTEFKVGYTLKEGICEETNGQESKKEDFLLPEIQQMTSKNEFKIQFPEGIVKFNKEGNLVIEIEDMKEEKDFMLDLSYFEEEENNQGKAYKLMINITKESYQSNVRIFLKNCTSVTNEYKIIQREFKIGKTLDKFFSLNLPQQTTTKKIMTLSANFGDYLTLLSPAIVSFLIPMNTLKIIALAPVKFPALTMTLLNLLVEYEEFDFTRNYQDKYIYSKEEKSKRIFKAKNLIFSFVSIYPRIRLLRIIIRLLINFLFLTCFKNLGKIMCKTEEEERAKPNGCFENTVAFLVKVMASMEHNNLPSEILYCATSLATGVHWIEYLIILLDFLMISYFQFIIFKFYQMKKKQNCKKLDTLLELVIFEQVYVYQRGEFLSLPITQLQNGLLVIKLLTVFVFQDFPVLFGVTFLFVSVLGIIILLKIMRTGVYIRTLILIKISLIVEFFVLVGISGVCFFKPSDKGFLDHFLTFGALVWILLSIIILVVSVVEKCFWEKKEENKVGVVIPLKKGLDKNREKKVLNIGEQIKKHRNSSKFRVNINQFLRENQGKPRIRREPLGKRSKDECKSDIKDRGKEGKIKFNLAYWTRRSRLRNSERKHF